MLKIAWNPCYAHPLPEGHRFPMEKYALLPEQLLHEGIVTQENFFDPLKASLELVLGIHDPAYVEKLQNLTLTKHEIRAMGFPLSAALVHRELVITGGTIQCVDYSLQYGLSANIAGGTHHAFRDRGEGFCILNDIAIGAHHAMINHGIRRILVVDLDVHQGNGTARIFENDSNVFTFSMHGEKNYPLHKTNSDLDINLPDKTGDDEYLSLLNRHLPKLISETKPELIFYQCGVDVLESDKLGRLSLSMEGCRTRDRMVFELAHENQIPIVCVMGGGYSEKISIILEAHTNTFREATQIYG